jgi:hypothetical protein
MNQATLHARISKGPGRPMTAQSGNMMASATAEAHTSPGLAQGALTPRLLDLDAAASYLSMSPWTIRELEAKGVLPRVRVPLPHGGELRKLLFDKADLDRLITAWKETAA